mmetsp:Transcript_5435/g.15110  ORF Transcript_5435/g.15110 Transcript_5435/m.15110 type:complete len:255 (-) Transcript_5435:2726-3490(-)
MAVSRHWVTSSLIALALQVHSTRQVLDSESWGRSPVQSMPDTRTATHGIECSWPLLALPRQRPAAHAKYAMLYSHAMPWGARAPYAETVAAVLSGSLYLLLLHCSPSASSSKSCQAPTAAATAALTLDGCVCAHGAGRSRGRGREFCKLPMLCSLRFDIDAAGLGEHVRQLFSCNNPCTLRRLCRNGLNERQDGDDLLVGLGLVHCSGPKPVLQIHICAKLHKELEHRQHPLSSRNVKRGPHVIITRVGVHAVL